MPISCWPSGSPSATPPRNTFVKLFTLMISSYKLLKLHRPPCLFYCLIVVYHLGVAVYLPTLAPSVTLVTTVIFLSSSLLVIPNQPNQHPCQAITNSAYLSDPSPIIGYACHSLTHWLLIWKLKFGHKAKFCSDFEHNVWSRVWSWSSSEILKLKYGQYFAAEAWWGYEVDVWSRFWS